MTVTPLTGFRIVHSTVFYPLFEAVNTKIVNVQTIWLPNKNIVGADPTNQMGGGSDFWVQKAFKKF